MFARAVRRRFPVGHLGGGNGAGFVKVEMHGFLGLRPPVADLAQIIEGALHPGLQEGLQAAQQIAPPEAGAAPRVMEQRLAHVETAVILHHPVQQFAPRQRIGLHDRGDEVVFGKVEDLDLVAKFLIQRGKGPGRVHRPVGKVRLPVPGHLEGFLQRFLRLVVQPDDELRFGEDIGLAQQADRLLVLGDGGFLVELVQLQLGRRLGAQGHMHQPRLAVEGKQVAVAVDVGHAGVDAPFDLVGQAAVDQLLAEFDELLLVDGRFLIRKNEEPDAVIGHQPLDLIHHLFRVAHAVVAPELPLRAEGTGKGAAPRHVRDRHLHAQRHVDVFVPFQDGPVRVDPVQVLDRGRGLGGHDLGALAIGQPLDAAPVGRPAAIPHRIHKGHEDFFALAAHDHVDPGRFGQDLAVHEGGMDAAQHPQRVWHHLLRDLQHLFGGIDRRCDRGDTHHIRRNPRHLGPDRGRIKIVGHGIQELHVPEPRPLQRPRQIGGPGGRPVARNLGPARVIIGMNKQDAHGRTLPGVRSS